MGFFFAEISCKFRFHIAINQQTDGWTEGQTYRQIFYLFIIICVVNMFGNQQKYVHCINNVGFFRIIFIIFPIMTITFETIRRQLHVLVVFKFKNYFKKL